MTVMRIKVRIVVMLMMMLMLIVSDNKSSRSRGGTDVRVIGLELFLETIDIRCLAIQASSS